MSCSPFVFRSNGLATTIALSIAILLGHSDPLQGQTQKELRWKSPATGFWNAGANWEEGLGGATGDVPNNNMTNTYRVVIDESGSPYIATVNVDVTIDDLRLNSTDATVTLTGNRTFSVLGTANLDAGTFLVNGGRLSGGNWVQSATGRLRFSNSTFNELSGVAVTGGLDLNQTNGYVRLTNGSSIAGDINMSGASSQLIVDTDMTFNGTINVSGGNGGSTIANSIRLNDSRVLTIGAAAQVNLNSAFAGMGKNLTNQTGDHLINNGTISVSGVNAANRRFINMSIFENHGTVSVSGGNILGLFGTSDWINTGSYVVGTGSTLRLESGMITTAGLGFVDNTAGGTVDITRTIDNTGATLALSELTGNYTLNGGTILGGTLSQVQPAAGNPGGQFLFSSNALNTFDGVAVSGGLTLGQARSYVQLTNGTSISGDINLSGAGANMDINTNFALNDTINITGANTSSGAPRIRVGTNSTLTITPTGQVNLNNEFAGMGQILPSPTGRLIVNQGTITAGGNAQSNPRFIAIDTFDNQNRVEIVNGNTLRLYGNSTWTNSGSYIVGSTSTLSIQGDGGLTTAALGMINNSSGGTVEVAGITSALAGVLDNTGDELILDSMLGNFVLKNGTIIGGTIRKPNTGTATHLKINGAGARSYLDNVAVSADMDLDKTQAYADFRNGATFTGNALLSGQSATVSAETDLTLNGKFTLSGNQSQINVNSATSAGATTLTLGPNSEVSMTGFGAKIQSDFFTNNTNQDVVINQGLISATRVAATGTYAAEISPDVFTNQGIVRANANTGVFLLRNVTNLDSPTLTGGTWESIGNNARIVFTNNVIQVTTNAATIVLDGTGSSFATAGGALETTLVNNSAGGVLRVLGGRGYTTSNSLGNSGTIELGDGTFNSTALNNQSGGVFQGFGTITPAVSNSGLVQASGGTLVASQGVQGTAGAVQIDANGTLDLSATAGSTTGSLLHNGSAASSLNLGAHNLAVSSDYNNANFGSGDGFNRNANVSATGGTIVAAGDVAQAITGANVQNGTAASPVLAFGNVHVGDVNTKTFQVANAGTTGPALRGAIQTGVNGGNISDSQLSGSGVTASNFGPVATGAASSDFSVTYTANNAGDLAAGQQVNITNNFGNVDDQQLGFTGTAYRLAAPSTITPNPITFGNQRVGGTALQTLTLANDAINDLYSESLSASFSGTSAATASGLVSGLAPGQTNNTNLIVGLDTSVAGAITGTATLQLNSDGAGSSELGITSLGTQTVNLSGNVYRPAVANTIADVTFANRHVVPAGQTVEQTINLQNLAAADGFSESLTASLAVASGTDITAGGSINSASRVIAGASDASNLTVGIDATSSGLKSGMATLSLNSDGTGASGLSDLVLSDQTFGVQGKVYALAKPNTVAGTIALGNHHVGATVQQSLTLSNTEAAGQYTEQLSASFSGATNGGATFNGSVTGLAGGANSTALNVGLDTSLAGDRSGSMALNLTSNEVDGSGLGTTALAGQSVSVSGTVYRLAAADSIGTINLGNAHVGDTLTQNVSLSNVAVADGFSEALSASFSGASNGNANFGGSGVTALAAGATDSSGLTVALNTDQAGLRSGAMLLNQSSNEINGSGLGTTGLAGQTVAVTGSVYNYAVASTISPTTHDFGIVHVGDVLTPNQLAFANEAIAGLYSEDLRLGNWVVSGDAQVVAGSPSSVTLIAGAQSLSDIGVVVDTSTAGLKAGTFAASQASTGQVNGVAIAGFSETSLGQSTSIAFAAQVNQYAVASVLPTAGPGSLSMTSVNEYLLDFGTVSPAFGNPLTAELTVSNAVLNAAFPSDDLSGSFMTSGAGLSFVGFDGFNGLAGGDQQAGFLVNLDTSKFGLINGQILFDPTGSNASGYSGALNRITINISGAVTAVPEPAAGLMLLLSLVGSLGLRRRRQLV